MFGTIKHERRGINTKGIGLGLYISKLIVEKMNGKINFFSKYRHGTTFFYTFQVLAYDVHSHLTSQYELKKKNKLKNYKRTLGHVMTVNTQAPNFLKQFSMFQQFQCNRIMITDDEEFCIASMKALLGQAHIDT